MDNHDERIPSHGPLLPIDHWRHRTGVQMDEFSFLHNDHRTVY